MRCSSPLASTIGCLLALAACGGAANPDDVIVRDSAGIEIVENRRPAWSEADGWRVSDDPVVDIGTVDGDPRYQIYRASFATRLDDGRIVVGNSGTHEIRFYDRDGTYLDAVGGEGEGPGEFRTIAGLWRFRGDSLLAWDSRLRRYSVWTRQGEYGRSFAVGSQIGFNPRGFGAFADGSIFIQEWVFRMPDQGVAQNYGNFYRLSPEGALLDSLGRFPTREIVRYPGGPRRAGAVIFSPFTFSAVHATDFYVAVGRSPEIAVHGSDGTPRRLVRWSEQLRPVDDALIRRYRDARLASADGEAERRVLRQQFEHMVFADVLPPYRRIHVDRAGNLWAQRYEIPGDDAPDRWLVFDPRGRMLGEVPLPDDLRVYDIGPDYLLGRVEDELGVEHVRLYRLVKSG